MTIRPCRGPAARKIIAELETLGVRVEYLWAAVGWYRSSPHADVMRWQGHGTRIDTGFPVSIGCWETMTMCARRGIGTTEASDEYADVMVWPKPPANKEKP